MNKTYKIIFVIALLSIVILVIGSSYAYFKATVTGDSESISIKSGKMELTFNDGTSEVSLPNAKPGDYMVKDFNVENTSTVNSSYDYEYIYNIKLVDVEVTFKEEDLEYKLEEYTDDSYTELKANGVKESGYINEETITEEKEMYIAARITRPPKGEKHYYRLTITFKNLEEVNQNYNQGAIFSAKINIDDNKKPIFGSNDLELAIYIDGDESKTVPEKGTAYYDGIECENDPSATASWDYDKWRLNSINTSLPNKCTIKFVKQSPLIIEKLKSINEATEALIIDDNTAEHNLRYVGANPDNYIWFNCDDYNGTMDETNCEKWRIIGLMNGMTIVGEEGKETPNQSLVKIIREEKIGDIAWDKGLKNNWATASLQKGLNGPYLNNSESSWITNSDYTSTWSANKADATYKSITSLTKDMIEQVTWNLGGTTSASITASAIYALERSNNTPSATPATWNGYIGLMYPSDYGFAAGESCYSTTLYKYDSCTGSNWLYKNLSIWTMTPWSSYDDRICLFTGAILYTSSGNTTSQALRVQGIRPTLYLTDEIKIKDDIGDGSIDNPYVIVNNN